MNSLANSIINELRDSFGVYTGNWTEPSIRTAGVDPAALQKMLMDSHPQSSLFGGPSSQQRREDRLRRNQQQGQARASSSIYGHWLLPNGQLTGQLQDHAQSAHAVLSKAIPGYQPKGDPIVDLMNYSGAIRVRHAPPVATVMDMVHQPTPSQHQKIAEMAKRVEDQLGHFQWNVINKNDTGTLGDGISYDEFQNFRWPNQKPAAPAPEDDY